MIRAAGPAFLERARRYFDRQHWKALHAILHCRTAALGGHIDKCSGCGNLVLSYNSCRNRSCPKCQGNARHRWLQARRAELLPTRYVHVVFTLPHELAPLALANKKLIYTLLFRLSAETLMEFARDPRLLGAEIGFFSVLHTWNQKLEHHPHVHCVVPEGGLAADGSRWVRPRHDFFLPVKSMAKAFRGKFREALEAAFAASELRFPGQLRNLATPHGFAALIRQCYRKKWVVLCQAALRRPGARTRVSRQLHAPHRYLQSPAAGFRRGQDQLPLARLSAQEQAMRYGAAGRRIPAAVLSPCAAAGIRAHPPFRLVRQSAAKGIARNLPPIVRRFRRTTSCLS